MKNVPAVATAAVALALAGVFAVLGVKMKNQLSSELTEAENTESSVSYNQLTSYDFGEDYPAESFTSYTDPLALSSDVILPSPSLPSSVTAENSSSQSSEADTSPTSDAAKSETSSVVERITSVTASVNAAFKEAFSMPKVPKYIPRESNINFDEAMLASYMYEPDGNYYYTNDKKAWQTRFGYNEVYDRLAVITAMYYDTVRTTFSFEGKDWLVQIWKGQYGYYFVGEEIGVYTKERSSSSQYMSAEKSDWLKMEMCFVWDEDHNGNYKPRFSRPYDDYWWCTGFVVGLESSTAIRTREQFRMVAHITFKNTEMATLFANAFEANGFKRVSKLDNNVKDTFVQIGPDVAFVWQSINQHVI